MPPPRRLVLGCFGIVGVMAVGALALVGFRFRSLLDISDNVAAVFEEPRWAEAMDTSEHVLQYIGAHRDDVGLLAATVNDDGSLTDLVQLNSNVAMPLGAVGFAAVLAGYATQTVAGRVSADSPVSATEWRGWLLPGTDGGAHADAVDALAPPDADSMPLSSVVQAMVRFGDPAAADTVLDHVGQAAVRQVLADQGLRSFTPIRPTVGGFLAWRSHDDPDESPERADRLSMATPEDLDQEIAALVQRWREADWHEAEVDWRRSSMSVGRLRYEAKVAEALGPSAAAAEVARVLGGAATGQFVSAEVSERMAKVLSWAMAVGRNADRFDTYGALHGSLPGLLTEALYAVPRQGPYAGRTRVVVVLLRRMPMSAWLRAMETAAHRYFALRLATRPQLSEQLRRLLDRPAEPGTP